MGNKAATDEDRTVGARITTLRKAKGLTQTALGVAIGVTFQQVQKYEKGTNRVSGSRLLEVARALDVPITALFGQAKGTNQNNPFAFLTEASAFDLLKAYVAISDEQLRRDVLALVRTAARMSAGPFASNA